MTPRRVAAVCALVALSAGVAVNVSFLQRGTVANWAARGALPVTPSPNTEPRPEISANPFDAPRTSSQSGPVFDVDGHDGRPRGEGADATPSPQPGSASADGVRTAEGASTLTTINDGDVIRAVQRELGMRGYKPGIPSGVVTAATRSAIMAFQHDHGLPLTGEPSEALLKAIVFEHSGVVRAPGNSAGTEQGKREAPIMTAAIKPHFSTSRASPRTA